MTSTIPIGIFELVLAAGLLLINVVLSVTLRLGLARSLLVAATRMVIQLALVGLVLDWIFRARDPLAILAMATVMAALASIAAVRRTRRRFPGVYWNSLVTITASSFVVTSFTLSVVVRPDPWFDPQYLIPLHGMLLGNALTGISLGLDRFTQYCVDRRSRIEALLALGATRWEAAIDPVRDALRTGLVPTLNSMAIMGIVSLPGMMTGQILAGADPGVAVRYQIMIMFMIASCVALATTGVVFLAYLRLFSARHELRFDRLR